MSKKRNVYVPDMTRRPVCIRSLKLDVDLFSRPEHRPGMSLIAQIDRIQPENTPALDIRFNFGLKFFFCNGNHANMSFSSGTVRL